MEGKWSVPPGVQSKAKAMQCNAVHVPLPCYQYFIINFTIFYWIIIGLSFLSNRTSLFQALNDDYCNPLVPSYCPDLPRRHRSRTWVTKLPQLGPPWPYFYSHYICMMWRNSVDPGGNVSWWRWWRWRRRWCWCCIFTMGLVRSNENYYHCSLYLVLSINSDRRHSNSQI